MIVKQKIHTAQKNTITTPNHISANYAGITSVSIEFYKNPNEALASQQVTDAIRRRAKRDARGVATAMRRLAERFWMPRSQFDHVLPHVHATMTERHLRGFYLSLLQGDRHLDAMLRAALRQRGEPDLYKVRRDERIYVVVPRGQQERAAELLHGRLGFMNAPLIVPDEADDLLGISQIGVKPGLAILIKYGRLAIAVVQGHEPHFDVTLRLQQAAA